MGPSGALPSRPIAISPAIAARSPIFAASSEKATVSVHPRALRGGSIGDDPTEWARELLASGPKSVVVTLGSEGALVASAEEGVSRVASVKVDAVDTTGAGDSFTAALAWKLGSGESLADAAAYAARVGAVAVTRRGAQESFPTAEEVDALCCASPGDDPRTPGRGPDDIPGAASRGESLCCASPGDTPRTPGRGSDDALGAASRGESQ